jgi:hypothetical protein
MHEHDDIIITSMRLMVAHRAAFKNPYLIANLPGMQLNFVVWTYFINIRRCMDSQKHEEFGLLKSSSC